MSRQTARNVLAQMNLRPALIAHRYAECSVGDAEVTSVGLIGDIREIAGMAAASMTDAQRERQEAARKNDLLAAYGFVNATQDKPFAFSGGKAIIPIHGLLINRCSWSWGFATGYNFIRAQVDAAMDDPDVDGIIYDVNSYGGMVAGCQETSDIIWRAASAQGGKPSLAVVDANCYSAGYMLASGADRLAVTPTGGAGSIGVVLMHLDVSGALDKMGLKVTFLHAGDHKVDGNPYEPLSAQVTSDLQNEINKMYDRFVATVARNRPGLTEAVIRDTQARCYQADDALALGLIDSVATPPDALESYFNGDGGADGGDEDDEDEDDQKEDADDGDDEDDAPEPDDDKTDPKQEGTSPMPTETKPAAKPAPTAAEAAAAARTAERERVRGIQTHAEAEGRGKLAEHLALNTDLSVEQAAGILSASPKAEAKPAATTEANHFKQAMDNGTQPNVGAGAEAASGGAEGEVKTSRAQQILAAQRRLLGSKPQAA